MYKLTERRLAKAKELLDNSAALLAKKRGINCMEFEMQLRECWDTGYREIKDIMQQLLKMPEYRLLAAYYMQNSGGPGIVSEFQEPLCKFYGIPWKAQAPDESTVKKFWSTAFAKSET